MKTSRTARFCGLLGLLAAFLGITRPAGAETRDVAELMPAETLAYVGWSQLFDTDDNWFAKIRAFLQSPMLMAQGGEDMRAASEALAFFEQAGRAAGGIGLLGVEMKDNGPDVQIAMIVDAGNASGRFNDNFRQLLGRLDKNLKMTEASVAGVKLTQTRPPGTPLLLLWGVHKDKFFVALGETAAKKIIDRLNGQGKSLLDNEEFKADRAKVKAADKGWLFCVFADVAAGLNKAKEIHGPPPPQAAAALDALGINSLRSFYVHADGEGAAQMSRLFLHITGPYNGILKFWEQKPLTEDDLKIIPKDAYWAQTTNLDLAALWKETLNVVGKIAPDEKQDVEAAPAQAAQVLGFSITDQLFPALGDTWTIYDAPSHGGLLITGIVLVAEVKDAKTLENILAQSVERFAPLLAKEKIRLTIQEARHGDHVIHYVAFGGLPIPVTPAWGFAGNRCAFGLLAEPVALALQQADPKTRGPSILDQPDVQAARKRLPADIQSFGYADLHHALEALYPFLQLIETAFRSATAGGPAAGANPRVLLTLPERLKNVSNSVSVCSQDKDGVLYMQTGSGLPLLSSLMTPNLGQIALISSILMPSLSRAREQAKRTVSAVNLRNIGMGCHLYANDNKDQFPKSLQELIDGGMLTPEMLQSPLSEGETNSYVYVAGHSPAKSKNPAQDILAYERIRDDEGVNTLFVDGHVEYMELERFKQALQDTYKRLGRENEMPANLKP